MVNLLGPTGSFSPEALSEAMQATGCTLYTCSIDRIGDCLSWMVFARGAWYQLEKLERFMDGLRADGIQAIHARTGDAEERPLMVPFRLLAIGAGDKGLLSRVFSFVQSYGGTLEEVDYSQDVCGYTSAVLCKAEVVFTLSSDISISRLREEYCGFCDKHNLDGQIDAFS